MRAFGLQTELLLVTPRHKLPFLFQYHLKTHRSILLHPLWRLTQLALLSFARRAQHRSVKTTLGTKMICTQTSEWLFWRAHNSNRLFSYFIFSSRNIYCFRYTRLCGMRHDRHDPWHPLAKLSNCTGRLQKNIQSVRHPVSGGGGLHHCVYKFIRLRNISQFRSM